MTIAACYPSSEGIVFGSDSTATMFVRGRGNQLGSEHYYTFCQKVFEFGEQGSSVGMVMWGLGALSSLSYRTLVSETADTARKRNISLLEDVAKLWAEKFWVEYVQSFQELFPRIKELEEKNESRTTEENNELQYWKMNLSGGFCLGGRWGESRRPAAFEILYNPLLDSEPKPKLLVNGNPRFWGCPNLIDRLALGIDPGLFRAILESDKWIGSHEDLFELISRGVLGVPQDLPIREAIDLVYAKIYTTIKTMKFSHLSPVCGGPIEIAVITSDRPFRWVCHKSLCEAITEGNYLEG